jgi:hypothetical protein
MAVENMLSYARNEFGSVKSEPRGGHLIDLARNSQFAIAGRPLRTIAGCVAKLEQDRATRFGGTTIRLQVIVTLPWKSADLATSSCHRTLCVTTRLPSLHASMAMHPKLARRSWKFSLPVFLLRPQGDLGADASCYPTIAQAGREFDATG